MTYVFKNSQSELRDSDVMDIRYLSGSKSLSKIATFYDIGKSTASDIINRITWSHVPEPKPVKGFNSYMIFPDGRVYCTKAKRFMKNIYTKKDGVKVVLSANGKRKSLNVANLVAQAFHSSNKNTIRFADGNRYNVHFTNIKI